MAVKRNRSRDDVPFGERLQMATWLTSPGQQSQR
jgi:hypothetical protein